MVYGSCHHVQIWVPPSGKDRCAFWRMVSKRVKGGEWWKELELFNLKDSRWGCQVELHNHHVWCSRSSRQGPVDGSAQCRGGFLQFGQLGRPTTEQAAALQDSSPSPVGTPDDRAEGIPT